MLFLRLLLRPAEIIFQTEIGQHEPFGKQFGQPNGRLSEKLMRTGNPVISPLRNKQVLVNLLQLPTRLVLSVFNLNRGIQTEIGAKKAN